MSVRTTKKTPKALAPANLTDLGYLQVYESGQYYRNRYIASNATARINGINADIVKQSQISVSAPDDTVLMNSAMGFLQALYPPVGTALGSQTLRNGRNVTAPMNGYQLITVDLVASGAGSEDSGWLQSTSNCAQAQISSNEYFMSQDYLSTLDRTREFYTSLEPVVNGTFSPDQLSFKNAYTSKIHNRKKNFPRCCTTTHAYLSKSIYLSQSSTSSTSPKSTTPPSTPLTSSPQKLSRNSAPSPMPTNGV